MIRVKVNGTDEKEVLERSFDKIISLSLIYRKLEEKQKSI